MDKIHTSVRLKQLMNERNLKQVDILRLAKPICDEYKVRLEKNDLSQYVSGKTEPGQHKLFVLAKALNVSETWLMGLDVPMERENNTSNTLSRAAIEMEACGITPYNPIVHKIPILGYISAGLPLYADEHIIDYTYTERNGGGEYFALKVKGDSMSAAQINHGNIVIVRKQENVENGEIAVVRVGREDATVKRFKRDGNTVQLIPQSFNPVHEIQIYNLENTEISVIGKVVECKIEF